MGGFSMSFDALPVAAVVMELDGTIVAANPAALAVDGRAAGDAVGRSVFELSPGLAAAWDRLVEGARRDGRAVDEIAHDGPDGRRHFQFVVTLGDHAGRPVVQALGIDITAHKRTEAETRARLEAQQQHAVQERLDSLGVVAGGIAHDFNNLLVGVLAEASAAREDATLGGDAREALRRIEAAARRMAQLTRQLLAYAGRAQLTMACVDADALVDELRGPLARFVVGGPQLAIALGAPGAVVEGDVTLLRQVVTNLVANAAEAGGGRIELATRLVAAAGTPWWQLEIVDDGPGIDTATLPHIFEPFFSTKHARHGLGLSAVHGIVRRLGGSIEVSSRQGGGARFVVRVPVIPGATPTRPGTADPAAPPRALPIHVLVADDEPSVRASVRRLLERRGATVTVAADGAEAIACLGAATYGLVIVDVAMPGRSGHDVLIAARAAQPGTPVVLMSGYMEQSRGDGCEEVPDDFVEKPFTAAALDAAIARVLAPR